MHHQSIEIRKVVKTYGAKASLLRRLERAGLLRPWLAEGKRKYSLRDIERLKTMLDLSEMGFRAPEIRELVGNSRCKSQNDTRTVPPDRIAAMVARYTAKRDQLTSRIDRLRSYTARGE